MESIAEQMKYPVTGIRIWPIIHRANETMRPSALDFDTDQNRPISEICENMSPWNVFLELVDVGSGDAHLPPIQKDSDHVLLFFKLYDPVNKFITYFTHSHWSTKAKTRDIIPFLNKKAGFPLDTPLDLYEASCFMYSQVFNFMLKLQMYLGSQA